jgi:hypothetical protein
MHPPGWRGEREMFQASDILDTFVSVGGVIDVRRDAMLGPPDPQYTSSLPN